MKYYRTIRSGTQHRLAVETESGRLADLTSIDESLDDLNVLVTEASLSGASIDSYTQKLLESGSAETLSIEQVVEDSRHKTGDTWLNRPFDFSEVWAAGVTYKTSEMERRRESDTPDVYSKVYTADRPELFLKATSDRCVGPFDSVGIRGDSTWNVPEPELVFVLSEGQIIGYTAGNDMSSRSIEGENPLYVPQAKVFDRCCAIGPCFVTATTISDPHNLMIYCTICRDGSEVFSGQASTSQMARKCWDLAEWLQRHNTIPILTPVFTGTSIVPPSGFTLEEGDSITIDIDGIGKLENNVVIV